jgi:DNA polymerase I
MVIIIDGNQLACRCYFALNRPDNKQELTTRAGKRTELICGFLSSFRKLVRTYKEQDSVFILTWDGGNAKRKTIFPAYKAGRKQFENAFYEQLDEIRNIINLLGIKQYYIKDVEADDIIGTLTIKCRKKGKKVFIISSDHDFEQLISNSVRILHPQGGDIIKDVQWVRDNYGIEPNKIVEVMSLTGDPTDNIPGIEKVGDKTAAKLVIANGSLDNIISKPDELKNLNRKGEVVEAAVDLKEKIKANIENIKLARRLCQIDCNMNLEPDLQNQPKNFEALEKRFKELEFESFLKSLGEWKGLFE